MVMHARKTSRLSDGYFEKHQSHPYQNSKYGSSKSYGSSSDRYENKFRDSPNGNYRSDSPESQSPRGDRDRSYQSKSSYLQKIREKERENRDYKMSRDKYSDCARSPKEKRSRDSEHRTNNDRNDEKSILHPIKASQLSSRDRKPMHNNCVDKRDDRDRVPRVGDWSEHVSSSGKKYYYNCKTEVSQWEKPREWVDRERDRFRGRDRDRDRDGDRSNYGGSGSSRSGTRHEKHSNSRGPNSSGGSGGGGKDAGGRDSATGSGGGAGGGGNSSRHWSSGSSRDDSDVPSSANKESSRAAVGGTSTGGGGGNIRKHSDENVQQATQDMDISPGDSTPTSETSYGNSSSQPGPDPAVMGPVLLANALPRLISHPIQQQQQQQPQSQQQQQCQQLQQHPGGQQPQLQHQSSTSPQGVVTSSNAPGPPMMVGVTTLPPTLRLATSQCDVNDKQGVGLMVVGAGGTSGVAVGGGIQRSASMPAGGVSDSAASLVHTSLSVDTSNHAVGTVVEGPPTPTHSETPDCTKVVAVPACSPSGGAATTSGLSSLQGVSSSLQALRPQGPTITPSLANHYRDDLVNHVRGWPADILEKQSQKLAEEAHVMGSIQCSKVSAELKSARSIVRLTEIQATLQEQRILFLRQQIKELEELKSQNSFMSDDS